MNRTLFMQYETGTFDEEGLQALLDGVSDVVGEDTTVCIIPDDIEMLSEEQVEEVVDDLIEALSDDE
jgi:Glu-tRNA(Gln) amidotransferase subunit E-like FAD-binding protein